MYVYIALRRQTAPVPTEDVLIAGSRGPRTFTPRLTPVIASLLSESAISPVSQAAEGAHASSSRTHDSH